MNEERTPFLTARFVGARFEGGRLPLSVLPELTVYMQIIQDLARHLFFQEHGGRERVPKGFLNAFAPVLTKIENGSAVAVIERHPEALLLPLGDDYFEKAQSLTTETIERVERGEAPPEGFPREFFKRFDAFGKGLRDDERIELRRGRAATGATYTRKVRKELVLKYSETYQQEVDVEGPIVEADVEKHHFHIRFGDRKVRVEFSKSDEPDVLRALASHETTDVRFSGTATFDRADRIQKVDDIKGLALFESLRPYSDRLRELRELTDGWLDGEGASPTAEAIASAERFQELLEQTDFPVPILFPTPEGGFQAEWSQEDGKREVTLCFEPDGSVLAVWSGADGDGEGKIDPGEVDVLKLKQLIETAKLTEVEE